MGQQNILVTGASGFIGSFLVEGGLERGMQVWAGVRKSSSRRYLQDQRIRFAELDFAHPDRLEAQLKQHKEEHNGWDCIIHCAGVTKCAHPDDFMKGNYEATLHLVEALQKLDMVPKQFIYLSSLSVFGAIHEADYTPIRETDTPQPNTAYGVSKLRTETFLKQLDGFPYVIFRPTGVYGPREKDYFVLVKSISRHLDMAAGFRRQDLTFVYVTDLADAIYLAVEKGVTQRAYFVSDGEVYTSRTFSDLVWKELGKPWMMRFTCPLWLLKIISICAGRLAALARKSSTLNPDKYKIMKQRNWRCDISPLVDELGYRPRYLLEEGVKSIVSWYKKEGWV